MARTKKKYLHNGIGFDSTLLIFMYLWLLLLKAKDIILLLILQPESFPLSLKVLHNNKTLLRLHIYTCDFLIKFKYIPDCIKPIFSILPLDGKYYILIKPSFDQSNMTRLFTINQKWLYKLTGIYVYKILVDKLFEKTFVPLFCRYTLKTKKLREKYKDHKTINEFLGE